MNPCPRKIPICGEPVTVTAPNRSVLRSSGVTLTSTSLPSRSTVSVTCSPGGVDLIAARSSSDALPMSSLSGVPLTFADQVAHGERTVGGRARADQGDLERRGHRLAQRPQGHGDGGVLRRHHLHLTLVADLVGGLVVGVDRLLRVHGVVAVQPRRP